jgi:ABC-type transporter Mla MlaB component
MLRIAIVNSHQPLTLKLSGRIAGVWVEELEKVWSNLSATSRAKGTRVDLSEVIFIDAEGRTLLARMWEQGARLENAHLLTKQVVDAIRSEATGGPATI